MRSCLGRSGGFERAHPKEVVLMILSEGNMSVDEMQALLARVMPEGEMRTIKRGDQDEK